MTPGQGPQDERLIEEWRGRKNMPPEEWEIFNLHVDRDVCKRTRIVISASKIGQAFVSTPVEFRWSNDLANVFLQCLRVKVADPDSPWVPCELTFNQDICEGVGPTGEVRKFADMEECIRWQMERLGAVH